MKPKKMASAQRMIAVLERAMAATIRPIMAKKILNQFSHPKKGINATIKTIMARIPKTRANVFIVILFFGFKGFRPVERPTAL